VTCFFVTDIHGDVSRYRKFFDRIQSERPAAVLLGGDLLPSGFHATFDHTDFIEDFLAPEFASLKKSMGDEYPATFLILGNDDPRIEERKILSHESEGLWTYAHQKIIQTESLSVLGYSAVPPTPFQFKDWERYDVSRYVDPGCISLEFGQRSMPIPAHEVRYRTIAKDLQGLTGDQDISKLICLFHSPPHKTKLDRAALDGQMIDHVPLDVHVGSIAIRRFIEERQPLLTLHGHIHESARITGAWREQLGRTHMFSAAHDGPELSLVRFDPENLEGSERELI
jgi:Icc-related predicted phosphoesterase